MDNQENILQDDIKEDINEAANAQENASANDESSEAKNTSSKNSDATTTNEATVEAEEKEDKHKKKKFGKDKGDKEKDALKEQVANLEDRVKRQLAEFENFRNRTEKEKASSYDNGAAMALSKMLPILDNIERGLSAVPADKADDPFVQGMDMIYKQFLKEFDSLGVAPIEAIGLPLDPNLHNAVMQQEMDGFEPGTICMEMQKGYTYHGVVLRHSMVAVVPE